jgi:3-hydroxybutyrate dehydrogenase
MLGLTQVTALEMADAAITCNAICPGYVYVAGRGTDRSQAKAPGIPHDQVIGEVLLAQQPNKRFATVDELRGIAVFLTSDSAGTMPARRSPSMAAGLRRGPVSCALACWSNTRRHLL